MKFCYLKKFYTLFYYFFLQIYKLIKFILRTTFLQNIHTYRAELYIVKIVLC